MKKIALLSGLALVAFNAYSATSQANSQPLCFSEKQCVKSEKGEEACNLYAKGFYQSSYPWLNQFIWQSAFPENRLPISQNNLQKLVQEAVRANTPNANSPDFFPGENVTMDIWQKVEESSKYAQVREDTYDYNAGAAHGIGGSFYYIFDKNSQTQLKDAAELVFKGQEKKMTTLLEKAYFDWLIKYQEFSPEDAQKTLSEPFGPLFPSDSWHIAKDTIVFDYNPYSIAPYAFGKIHLTVPAEKLQGIVKEDILKAAKEWKVPYQQNDEENPDYKDCLPEDY